MQVTTIGIDLAKNIFHVVCCNDSNTIVRKKKLTRGALLGYLTSFPKCVVAMEACSTSNYWGREISALGHDVKLLPAQHVKAFLTGNKNDYNDAHAIVVASKQSHIKAVAVKTVEQQDNQLVHNVRDLTIRQRTALSNHIRGFLLEYGIVTNKGMSAVRKKLIELLSDDTQVSTLLKTILSTLYKQLVVLDENIHQYEATIKQQAKDNEICQRLTTIPGVGPVIASSLFNEIGNGAAYRRGRDVSASLGLVPRQHSTGGKDVLLGISKRGNKQLRCLLVQGAKSVVIRAKHKTDKLSVWINKLVMAKGHNKACIAYANKMARMAWAISVTGKNYQAA